MKVIYAFDELVNFVHVEIQILVQTHTVLVNSKAFLKYDVSWNCLLVYPFSLNVGLTNLKKATWEFSLVRSLLD